MYPKNTLLNFTIKPFSKILVTIQFAKFPGLTKLLKSKPNNYSPSSKSNLGLFSLSNKLTYKTFFLSSFD